MYYYKINFIDEIAEDERTEGGILAAKSYGTAADKLVEYYGKKNVISIGLYAMEDDILCEDEIKEMFDEGFKL